MNTERLVILLLTLMGFMISAAGMLIMIYFNFNYIRDLSTILRYVGFCIGLILMFIGFHILIVGLTSLRS